MKGKAKDTNPRGPVNGVYIRNISPDDDFRLRIPKKLVESLKLENVRKLAVFINEKGQIVIDPNVMGVIKIYADNY